jgi:hypothetical protein
MPDDLPEDQLPEAAALGSQFAADSPLEGAGFEPSVPRQRVSVGDAIR